MHVIATRLTERISVVLVDDAGAWRFDHWMDVDTQHQLTDPAPEDLERRFTSSETALSYFRSRTPVSSPEPRWSS